MRNMELEEENQKLRSMLEQGAVVPAGNSEELNFYMQRVGAPDDAPLSSQCSSSRPLMVPPPHFCPLQRSRSSSRSSQWHDKWCEAPLPRIPSIVSLPPSQSVTNHRSLWQSGGRRTVFHSEQCLDGHTLYGYPTKVEQYRCAQSCPSVVHLVAHTLHR